MRFIDLPLEDRMVGKHEHRKKFHEEIGFTIARKQNKLEEGLHVGA